MPKLMIEEDCGHEYADSAQKPLEDILEERLKGPFIPIPDDLEERVMKKAMERVRQHQAQAHL